MVYTGRVGPKMRQKPLILVVDDDAPTLALMRSILSKFGFDSREAGTGWAAVESATRDAPDLVLLDKNMPGMSGSEVIRALRAEPSLRQVPILILSGEPVQPDELHVLGANGAVQKPFDIPALVEQIRVHVGVAR